MKRHLTSIMLACGLCFGGIVSSPAADDAEQEKKAKMQAENIINTADRYKKSMIEHETKLKEILAQLDKTEQQMKALAGKEDALGEMGKLAKLTNTLNTSADDLYESAKAADKKHLDNNQQLWNKIVSGVDKKPAKTVIEILNNTKKTADKTITEAETIFSGLRNLVRASDGAEARIFAIYETKQAASGGGQQAKPAAKPAEDHSGAKKLLELENYLAASSKTLDQQLKAIEQSMNTLSSLTNIRQYRLPGYSKSKRDDNNTVLWNINSLNEGMKKAHTEGVNIGNKYKEINTLIKEMLGKLAENPQNFAKNIAFLENTQSTLKSDFKTSKDNYSKFKENAKTVIDSNGTAWFE